MADGNGKRKPEPEIFLKPEQEIRREPIAGRVGTSIIVAILAKADEGTLGKPRQSNSGSTLRISSAPNRPPRAYIADGASPPHRRERALGTLASIF